MANDVANTILQQLGGHHFLTMTGAKDLMADGDSLCMTLRKNGSKANRLRITLNALDLYDMRFFRRTGGTFSMKTLEITPIKETNEKVYPNLYCDQLQEVFTRHTGMRTHL